MQARPEDLILAVEESHGIMAMPQIRDKDAAAACLLLAELALDEKRHGCTVLDRLDDIARQFGYFRNEVQNIAMTGIEGRLMMTRMMESLRANPPGEIAGSKLAVFEDLRDPNGRLGPIKSRGND